MSEIIRYARIGKEDINFGTGTFEVRLADGRVVTLQQVDLGELLSDASISTRDVTLDSLTVATLTVSGTVTPSGTLRIPEKADPSSPVSGEIWINSSATVPEYADDATTPTKHALVGDDTTQTLTNKTLTSPTLTTPVLSGTATGTYALGGTPSLAAPLDVSDEDLTSIDELHFADAAANPTTAGRLRRNGANIVWNDGTTAKIIVLRDAIQTLTQKTIDLSDNTLTGTTAQFNTALSDGSFATLDGSETLTNKILASATNQVSSVALKTSTGSASGNTNGAADLSFNDYSFFPNFQQTSLTNAHVHHNYPRADTGTTIGAIRLPTTADASDTYVIRWRYMTASDDPTIWVARHLVTGMVHGVWASDDPISTGAPGLQVEGCESILLKATDLEQLSELSAKASEAQAYIRDRKMKMQHHAYRALQLLANDAAPSQWLYTHCEFDGQKRLKVKK